MESIAKGIGYTVLTVLGFYLFQYLIVNPYFIPLIIIGLKFFDHFFLMFKSSDEGAVDYETLSKESCTSKGYIGKTRNKSCDESSSSSPFYMESDEVNLQHQTSTVLVNTDDTSSSQSVSKS